MRKHYSDIIMSAMASQTTGVSIVYATVCSGADQRKHQSSAPLAFVRGIHRSPVNSPHQGPVTRKIFPFDDVIMKFVILCVWYFLRCSFGHHEMIVQIGHKKRKQGPSNIEKSYQDCPSLIKGNLTVRLMIFLKWPWLVQIWRLRCEWFRWFIMAMKGRNSR